MNHLPHTEVLELLERVLARYAVRPEIGSHVARGLVESSLRGVDSHGVQLFPHYVEALKAGRINGDPDLQFDRESLVTATLDADHTFGHASGAIAMERAVALAKKTGAGFVSVRNSTHFGAAAYFGLMAARQDMIGLAFTHATPHMLYPEARTPTLGPNALCFTAPIEGEDPFCLDMATTTVTFNKLKMASESGNAIGADWGADEDGAPTTNPDRILHLLPIGGYKGYGLAMMLDIMCGMLSGMPVGRDVSAMYGVPLQQKRELGHFFGAIAIGAFEAVPTFKARMRAYCDAVRGQTMRASNGVAMVAGDPEKEAYKMRRRTGIPLSEVVYAKLRALDTESAI